MGYQSRYVRRPNPPRIVLTERDERLILTTYSFRWATRQQLQAIALPAGVTRANLRLRALFDSRFLDRLAIGTVGAGLQPVYLAGEAAVPLIASRFGIAELSVRERLRDAARCSATMLGHDLRVNDERVGLTRVLGAAGADLECWLNAAECFDAYEARRCLRPDGFAQFVAHRTRYACFQETDRGTVSLDRWAAKVAGYVRYRDSGAFTNRYGLTRFRVLVTAPSNARISHLVEATCTHTDRGFWFALSDEVVGLPDLLQPIWRTLTHAELQPLVKREGET